MKTALKKVPLFHEDCIKKGAIDSVCHQFGLHSTYIHFISCAGFAKPINSGFQFLLFLSESVNVTLIGKSQTGNITMFYTERNN